MSTGSTGSTGLERTAPRTASLVVEGLKKRFAGAANELFDDLNLTVERGEMVGLVGSNGSGKTTLTGCIVGMVPFQAGSVRIAGVALNPRDGQAKRALGYVPDDHPIRLKLTVREYLELCAVAHRVPRAEARERVQDAIERGHLGEFANLLLEACSHGITKRVAMASALLHGPELLVLDEPESGLDAFAFATLARDLEAHQQRGGGILVATHRLDWAVEHCDRVVRLEQGALYAVGADDLTALAS